MHTQTKCADKGEYSLNARVLDLSEERKIIAALQAFCVHLYSTKEAKVDKGVHLFL